MDEDNQVTSSAVLEETFYVTSKKNTYYKVKLTEKGLSLQKDSNGSTKIETIPLNDIIGCRCMRSKRRSAAGSCACRPGASRMQLKLVESMDAFQTSYDEYDTSAYLYIYAYTLKKVRMKGIRRRERTTITLRFRSFDKYEDNLREASRWRLAIKCLVTKLPVPKNLMSPSHGNLEALLGGKCFSLVSSFSFFPLSFLPSIHLPLFLHYFSFVDLCIFHMHFNNKIYITFFYNLVKEAKANFILRIVRLVM